MVSIADTTIVKKNNVKYNPFQVGINKPDYINIPMTSNQDLPLGDEFENSKSKQDDKQVKQETETKDKEYSWVDTAIDIGSDIGAGVLGGIGMGLMMAGGPITLGAVAVGVGVASLSKLAIKGISTVARGKEYTGKQALKDTVTSGLMGLGGATSGLVKIAGKTTASFLAKETVIGAVFSATTEGGTEVARQTYHKVKDGTEFDGKEMLAKTGEGALGGAVFGGALGVVRKALAPVAKFDLNKSAKNNIKELNLPHDKFVKEIYLKILLNPINNLETQQLNLSIKRKILLKFVDNLSKIEQIRIKKFKKNIANGNYNQDIIDFKPMKTIQEINNFIKSTGIIKKVIGVKTENDISAVNDVLEAMVCVHTKTQGRVYMPRTIKIVPQIKSADGICGSAAYKRELNQLIIPRDWKIYPEVIYHELGHAQHSINANMLLMRRPEELSAIGMPNYGLSSLFLEDEYMQNLIKICLREYSATSPAEFCADKFAADMQGIILPNEINELYDILMNKNGILDNTVYANK